MRCRKALLVFLPVAVFCTFAAAAQEVVMVDGIASESYKLLIGDKKQWDSVVDSVPISSASGYVSVEPDAAVGELNATWNGKGEAQLFLAHDGPQDYTEFLEQDAALVVVLKVVSPPKRKVTIRMGCGYPCAANADVTKLLIALPEEQWLRVSFDLKCFVDSGLNIRNVDTPLLLTTTGKMAISITDVGIIPDVGTDATIHCR